MRPLFQIQCFFVDADLRQHDGVFHHQDTKCYCRHIWSLLAFAQYVIMMLQMILHEGLDEIIAMVVAFMAAQAQGMANLGTDLFKHVRVKLFFQEFVGQTLIDQDFRTAGVAGMEPHENARIMLFPSLAVTAQISAERLFAPGAFRWRADRRERRNRAVKAGVPEV
jgi:hypothetical protein